MKLILVTVLFIISTNVYSEYPYISKISNRNDEGYRRVVLFNGDFMLGSDKVDGCYEKVVFLSKKYPEFAVIERNANVHIKAIQTGKCIVTFTFNKYGILSSITVKTFYQNKGLIYNIISLPVGFSTGTIIWKYTGRKTFEGKGYRYKCIKAIDERYQVDFEVTSFESSETPFLLNSTNTNDNDTMELLLTIRDSPSQLYNGRSYQVR